MRKEYLIMKSLTVTQTFEWDCAHLLADHPGKCKNIHGHRYKLEVTIDSNKLVGNMSDVEKNMCFDSYDIKTLVNKLVVDRLDHGGPEGQTLNDIMKTNNPTVEFMIQWIFNAIGNSLPLKRLRLWETPNFYAELEIE